MKPAPFAYHRAVSIEDAIAHLKDADAIVAFAAELAATSNGLPVEF